MSPDTPQTGRSARGLSNLPRAVWVAGGLMSLVTAGLAGALVMQSPSPSTSSAAPSTPQALTSGAPSMTVPPMRVAAGPSAPFSPLPGAAPAPVARPLPPAPHSVSSARRATQPLQTTHAAACLSCGTVESVSAVRVKGEGTGLGAVAGGVLGGVLGHQIGGGNGKTAATVLGAIGGGVAGNEVERRTRGETTYDVHVRMEDGSRRVIRQAQAVAVGASVVVEAGRVRVARDRSQPDAPVRALRTSNSNGQRS